MFPVVLALFGLGAPEIALILLVVILFFGAAKIPELARAVGKAKGEFEKGTREGREAAAAKETTMEAAEEARVLKAAKELGIPTDGRSVADIKADVRARLT